MSGQMEMVRGRNGRLYPSVLDRLADGFALDGECWIWTGYCNARGGYGRISVGGRIGTTHRTAYELLVEPVPDGLTLDHLCRNTACFNPDHLEIVTVAENIRRGTQGWHQRAKTHCPQGHPYDEANTHVNTRGERMCRTCGRERMRARRAAA